MRMQLAHGKCRQAGVRLAIWVSRVDRASVTQRYYELDVMKAASIVAVVFIHSTSPFWFPNVSSIDRFVGYTARFAVPAFLAVSGFLYYSAQPILLATVLRRARRILLPYFVASAMAYAFGILFPRYAATTSLLKGLLVGGTFGPYYYVFVLVQFVLATWLLSRFPPPLMWLCLLASIVTSGLAEVSFRFLLDPFWTLRRGDTWAFWFLLGWMLAAHRDVVFAFTKRYRPTILCCWFVCLVVSSAVLSRGIFTDIRLARAVEMVLILANLMGLFSLKRGTQSLPRSVLTLSNWSYAIYLFHPFFIYLLQETVERHHQLCGLCVLLLRCCAGLGGALCVTYTARRFLGPLSRDVVGA